MILGKTRTERRLARAAAIDALVKTRLVFAWLPIRLHNGQWAWLERVERHGYHYDWDGDLVRFDYFRA